MNITRRIDDKMAARILVIEDNPINLELMTYLLGAFNHTVLTATDGNEGYNLIEQERVDLIICDVHLPKVDGYQVARRLKQHPELRKVPIVAVTALAMVGDREKVLAAGFDDYISKPVTPDTFVKQLEGLIQKYSVPPDKRH
jgi:CheY-like chemotaxis protein